MTSDADNEELLKRWYERKSALMEASLGKEHDILMHAVIPYYVGGALDLYYYLNGLPGTAIATKELCELPNAGPSNDMFRRYELVMFTKQRLDIDAANDESTAFGRQHQNIKTILNLVAPYSTEVTLNPNDTCELVGGQCVFFVGYACHADDMVGSFGLLAVIEVFRSEMEYAQRRGTPRLIERLKSEDYYPYSDLDREPVA
jgi:hypothetical protein